MTKPLELRAVVVLARSRTRRRAVVVELIRFHGRITRVALLFRGERTVVWTVPGNVVVVKAAKK